MNLNFQTISTKAFHKSIMQRNVMIKKDDEKDTFQDAKSISSINDLIKWEQYNAEDKRAESYYRTGLH